MLPDPRSLKTERTCSRCGLVFFSDKIDAMCPACLISNTLDSEDIDEGPAFWEETTVKKNTPARTFSHFELLDELGRGGMGVVYRARDLNTERIVALKVLQAHHLDVPDLVLRFRSEVRAVSSLDHSYVLPIHEVGEYEGIPFFSMKLTTGGSLAQSIGNYRNKPREASQLLAKVARGVQHAHERGILHRDLKPGNILLDAAGEPYVCDFGLAKWIEDDQKLTVTAAVLGTPHYIAPEQALGSKALTTAVDIYSLGAILYELLTGRPPFIGATVLETLVASQEKTPDRPSSIAKNVPADLETICLKALEHSPGSRYATAGAFADDLENWIAGRPITARPVNAAEQLWRWAKRNPLPALLVIALFGTLVTIAIGSTVAAVRIDRARERAVAAEAAAKQSEGEAKFQLFQSLHDQARASVQSGVAGQRFNTLVAIHRAAELNPVPDLRTEAVAALSLYDLRIKRRWTVRNNPLVQPIHYDANLKNLFLATPDGDLEATAIAETPTPRIFKGNGKPIFALAGGENRFIAARSEGAEILVWDLRSQQLVYNARENPSTSKGNRWVYDFTFSKDESLFAIPGPGSSVLILDTSVWKEAAILETEIQSKILSFDPHTPDRIAIADMKNPVVEIWKISKKPIRERIIPLPAVPQHIDWRPDGDQLAIGCRDYNIYLLSPTGSGRAKTLVGHNQDVTQVCYSNSGQMLASTARDRTIRIWDVNTATLQVTMAGVGAEAALRFSPDGSALAATDYSNDAVLLEVAGAQRACSIWSTRTEGEFVSLVSSISFSPDGTLAALGSFGTVSVWNVAAERCIERLEMAAGEEKSVRFIDNSTLLVASAASRPRFFKLNVATSKFQEDGSLNTETLAKGLLGSPNYDKKSDLCFTASEDGEATIYNLLSHSRSLTLSKQTGIWDMVKDPANQWVATAYSGRGGNTVSVWEVPTGSLKRKLPAGAAGTLCLSPDASHLITTGGNGGIVWDTRSWSQVKNLRTKNVGPDIQAATYSYDGRFLAVSTSNAVALFETSRFEEIALLTNKTLSLTKARLAFSPDGNLLITQGADNAVCCWNLRYIWDQLNFIGLPLTSSAAPLQR